MKRPPPIVAVLLPLFAVAPFWYLEDVPLWVPVCQMSYVGFIGPLSIGIYGLSKIVQKKEQIWKAMMLCVALSLFGVFLGYVNWGLSTGNFLSPDDKTIMWVIYQSKVAVIITGVLLIAGWITIKIKTKPNK